MGRIRLIGLTLFLSAIVTSAEARCGAADGERAEGPLPPDLRKLLDQPGDPEEAKVATRTFVSGGRQLKWVALSWGAPAAGALFVTDCSGRKLLRFDTLGYENSMKEGPIVFGKETLEVRHVPAAGPNMKVEAVSILQFNKDKVSILWEHKSLDGSYPPSRDYGEWKEYRYAWMFDKLADRISVTGNVYLGHDLKQIKSLRPEYYCLRKAAGRYVNCRPNGRATRAWPADKKAG